MSSKWVFTASIGDGKSYFTGSADELRELADWTLDWRKSSGWKGKVWAPSIPGFGDNIPAMLNWLRHYPRAREFDAFPVHLYHLVPEHVGKRMGRDTAWTGLLEFRDGLAALGLGPVVDSEKGFGPGKVQEGTLYNYAVPTWPARTITKVVTTPNGRWAVTISGAGAAPRRRRLASVDLPEQCSWSRAVTRS